MDIVLNVIPPVSVAQPPTPAQSANQATTSTTPPVKPSAPLASSLAKESANFAPPTASVASKKTHASSALPPTPYNTESVSPIASTAATLPPTTTASLVSTIPSTSYKQQPSNASSPMSWTLTDTAKQTALLDSMLTKVSATCVISNVNLASPCRSVHRVQKDMFCKKLLVLDRVRLDFIKQ